MLIESRKIEILGISKLHFYSARILLKTKYIILEIRDKLNEQWNNYTYNNNRHKSNSNGLNIRRC